MLSFLIRHINFRFSLVLFNCGWCPDIFTKSLGHCGVSLICQDWGSINILIFHSILPTLQTFSWGTQNNAYLKSHFTTLLDIALSFGKRLIALAGIFKITVLSILKLAKRQTRYLRIIPPYFYETRWFKSLAIW